MYVCMYVSMCIKGISQTGGILRPLHRVTGGLMSHVADYIHAASRVFSFCDFLSFLCDERGNCVAAVHDLGHVKQLDMQSVSCWPRVLHVLYVGAKKD